MDDEPYEAHSDQKIKMHRRRISQVLHQAVAHGEVEKVRSLLDQGANADSTLYINLCAEQELKQSEEKSNPQDKPSVPTKIIPRLKRSFSIKWTRTSGAPQVNYENYPKTPIKSDSISSEEPETEQDFEGVALFEAVKEGLDITVQTLLETSNIEQNTTDDKGFTPVMQAAWHGQNECLKILLQNGADALYRNNTGCTAAHFAAGQGHYDCLQTLIEHGVPVDLVTKFGATPLILAAKGGHMQCMEFLLSQGANPNAKYRGNQNAILFAANNGHYECVDLLLKNNVQPDDSNSQLITPLMRAAQHGHNDCLVLLLENGAMHDKQDINGRTPIHYAVENDNSKGVKLLLKYGADPEVATKRGSTPLTYCDRYASFKSKEIIENHLNKKRDADLLNSKMNNNIDEEHVTCVKFRAIIRRRSRGSSKSSSPPLLR